MTAQFGYLLNAMERAAQTNQREDEQPMKNKMSDLRNHLFVTIESLLDDDNPMELERARAVSDVAQTIINSAKAETDFMRTAGRITGTDFIPLTDQRADVEA